MDADYDYARTKCKGEEIMKEYSSFFSCTSARLAAVYSDWCEYPPLYVFLETWLSDKWNSRILGGRGESSITYIHISDLIKFFLKIMENHHRLPAFNILVASPGGTVSHKDIYRAATKYYYGHTLNFFKTNKIIAAFGIYLRYYWCKISGKYLFERPWMIQYIDTNLVVENSVTCKLLLWNTQHRNDILRRLLFVIDKMKTNQVNWKLRNETALKKITKRPNMLTYNIMLEFRKTIVEKTIDYVLSPENHSRFFHYQQMDRSILEWFCTLSFQVIAVNIKNRDRELLRNYLYAITYRRYLEGFGAEEITDFIYTLGSVINSTIISELKTNTAKREILENINLIIHQTQDEIEENFDYFSENIKRDDPHTKVNIFNNKEELKRIVKELEDVFFESKEYRLSDKFRNPHFPLMDTMTNG